MKRITLLELRKAERALVSARKRYEADRAPVTGRRKCRGCAKELVHGSRGRPPEWCKECRKMARRMQALASYHRMAKRRKGDRDGRGDEALA